jgi:hypothetical protein
VVARFVISSVLLFSSQYPQHYLAMTIDLLLNREVLTTEQLLHWYIWFLKILLKNGNPNIQMGNADFRT